jgi:hypothetical protein
LPVLVSWVEVLERPLVVFLLGGAERKTVGAFVPKGARKVVGVAFGACRRAGVLDRLLAIS